MSTKLTVAVGLSGGVDSAVAAALLVEQGFSVMGITMLIWSGSISLPAGKKEGCFGPSEAEDVETCQKLCRDLGIEYRAIDLRAEYEARVLAYFRREYLAGRTPNPCIVCNSELKFGFLTERAQALGLEFEYFATGHYARIAKDETGASRLRAALDPSKDQSYFLYRLGPDRLAHTLFPLGELTKGRVREIAKGLGLAVADKAESQDFISGGDYSPLFARSDIRSGNIIDSEGRILGQHRGLPYYTIGQRKGLGIGAGSTVDAETGDSEALYVTSLDPEKNQVVVGPSRGLFAESLMASDFRLYSGTKAEGIGIRGFAKLRQNQKPVACTFYILEGGAAQVDFDESQRALAPGQSVVIYDAEGFVLGGGIIEKALP